MMGKTGQITDVLGVLLGCDALRGVHVCGSKVLGEIELALDNVDADNLGSTVGLCDGSAEKTDGTSAHDNDRVTRLDARLLDDVDSDGERLDQGSLLERNIVGKLEAKVGGGRPETSQGTVIRRRSGKDHIRAEVVLASEAVLAATARVSRLKSDAITSLEGLDLVANLNNSSGGLVA
ncbi:hypothetical protein HG531_003764 [Fusarium graminearum]|nr:hypothetical protein HG531_003764 [Fusarium graminearum]